MEIPQEFRHYIDNPEIEWDNILRLVKKKMDIEERKIVAFTDVVIELATKESMNKHPNEALVALGVEAALVRGRLADVLFLSNDSENPQILSLRAVALFVLSDVEELRNMKNKLEGQITETSPIADRVRLSTVKVLLAAAERDTSVIICVMEFDNLLETYPEQVEEPLTETMFTLYVVGTMLRDVGEASRADRIADTLEKMAKSRGHRMMLALVENLKGNICHLIGDIKEAENHYYKFKEISKKLSFDLGVGMALNNLGSIMTYSLRIEDAYECLVNALAYMNTDSARLITLTNLGEITTLLGKYEEAEEHFIEALRLETKTQKGLMEVYTLYCDLLCRQNRIDEAEKYLKMAEELSKTTESPLQKCAYIHAKGILLAAKKEYTEALKTFEEELTLAKEKNVFEMLIRSKLELARTYIKLFEMTKISDMIDSAMYHLDDLAQIGKEQKLNSLRGRIMVLKSDLLRMAGRGFEARGYLERVLSISKFIEDEGLERETIARLETIAQDEEISIEEIGIGRSLDRVAAFRPVGSPKKIPYPTLHAIIAIDRASGLTEYVYYFNESLKMDSSIVSGFIAAVGAFSSQLMGSSGNLRSISHEGFTLMMEYTERRIIALIATDESFELRYRLREFANQFDSKFPPLENLEAVEPGRYEGALSIIDSLFADIMA